LGEILALEQLASGHRQPRINLKLGLSIVALRSSARERVLNPALASLRFLLGNGPGRCHRRENRQHFVEQPALPPENLEGLVEDSAVLAFADKD
jgi:hypothetical protein